MAEPREHTGPGDVPGQRRSHEAGQHGLPGAAGDGSLPGTAGLDPSLNAMTGALLRLAAATDLPQAMAAAAESVWWVTAVDAALTRHEAAAYRLALASLDPAARKAVERSFAGFRFIRSQLGPCADPGDFIGPPLRAKPGPHGPTSAVGCVWIHVPPPSPQRGTSREMSPYREYRVQLGGKPVAETLQLTADFLLRVHSATQAAA